MKKRGFTLSELIVTLGIVGVIAALSITMLQRVMPDKDKGMVLKAYKVINEINDNILNDPSLYLPCNGAILTCDSEPVDGNHEDGYSGDEKYPHLFSDNLNLVAPYKTNGTTYDFISTDGIRWSFLKTVKGYQVTIDVGNPIRDSNCLYNSSSCKNPRQFRFNVGFTGKVTAGDNLTKAYLENPDNLHDRHADLKRASEL